MWRVFELEIREREHDLGPKFRFTCFRCLWAWFKEFLCGYYYEKSGG